MLSLGSEAIASSPYKPARSRELEEKLLAERRKNIKRRLVQAAAGLVMLGSVSLMMPAERTSPDGKTVARATACGKLSLRCQTHATAPNGRSHIALGTTPAAPRPRAENTRQAGSTAKRTSATSFAERRLPPVEITPTTTTDAAIVKLFAVPAKSPVVRAAALPPREGNDVAEPNCAEAIPKDSGFGLVGITGGKNFNHNSCLATEAKQFPILFLYANSDFLGTKAALAYQNTPQRCQATDTSCLAKNYGFNAGLDAASYARSQHVVARAAYLDVETENDWSSNTAANYQSILGEIGALEASGIRVAGIYSTSYQWGVITGNSHDGLEGLSNWVATGLKVPELPQGYCDEVHTFIPGPLAYVQYTSTRTGLDTDIVCNPKT
jgi:hypothetical protein